MFEGTSLGPKPPSEMHRSLQIPEVIAMICSQLKPIPWIREAGERDLAVLARTCTFFHDAGLDALWSHQDTLMNLVRCMPADLWKVLELPGVLAFLCQTRVNQSRPIVGPTPQILPSNQISASRRWGAQFGALFRGSSSAFPKRLCPSESPAPCVGLFFKSEPWLC
ncbi:hypothetical protein DFH06DRAFT_285473 [Mycena polygramma]|nr:hypothetical protein DFH06DRAFT_285473 [Mycena polygramma]